MGKVQPGAVASTETQNASSGVNTTGSVARARDSEALQPMEHAPLDGQIVDLKMFGTGDWLPGCWWHGRDYEPMWWAWFKGEERPVSPTAWRFLTATDHLSKRALESLGNADSRTAAEGAPPRENEQPREEPS